MSIGSELEALVAPLVSAFGSPEAAEQLLRELGLWSSAAPVAAVPGVLSDLVSAGESASSALRALDSGGGEPGERLAAAIEATAAVFDAVSALATALDGATETLTGVFATEAFWTELALLLPTWLLATWLRGHHGVLYASLDLVGALDSSGGVERLDFEALAGFVADPPGHMADRIAEDPTILLPALRALASAVGSVRVRHRLLLDGHRATVDRDAARPRPPRLDLGLALPDGGANWSVEAALVEGEVAGEPALELQVTGLAGVGVDIPLGADWTVSASAGAEGQVGFALNADGIHSTTSAATSASIELVGAPAAPWPLIGEEGATRLELAGLTVACEAESLTSSPDVTARLSTEGLRLVITAGEGDSFVSELLGGGELAVEAGLDITWSTHSGFSFGGEAGFGVEIPLNLVVGPVTFFSLGIAVRADADGVALELTTTLSAELGPIAFMADEIGLAVTVSSAEDGQGDLGDVDFGLAFVPPTGFGVEIDFAGVVRGGGAIVLRPDEGRYEGTAILEAFAVGITATGILATKLPDGAEGWSLYFSLAATFTGVQLGFGFTLNGVGGLIGINRGLDEDALSEGIRTGALDSILFPDDPVADAPKILSDIDSIFPTAVGQYVFGPIAKIGWGTPTLIEVDLGVVIQLPEPLTITLLGSLSTALPTKDAAIVELNVDVAGTLNLTEGTLRIDASLRDSRVLTLELTGDMAVRASFFDSPSFLISFGGFHPDFAAPADFPAMQRLGVALDAGDDLRLTLGGYFAVTSNTVQFGAEFTVVAKAIGFTAEGGAAFDALIQFKPFGFTISMKVWVTISAGSFELLGVLLAGDLSGPNPWRVKAEATFKVLGVKKTLPVNATIGDKEAEPPQETVFVGDLLVEELRIESAWTALPPDGDGDSGIVVLESGGSELEVHPAGRLEVRQRVVPLDTRIDHYGNAKLGGADTFRLEAPRIGEVDFEGEAVEDFFAAAHYFELDEDEKLSSPSFEEMPAGLRLGDDAADGGDEVEYTYDYEVVYRDPNARGEERERTGKVVNAPLRAMERALSMSAALGARKALRLPRSTKQPGAFSVAKPTFTATDAATGEVFADVAAGASFFGTRDAVRRADDAVDRVVLPVYELELLG